MNEMERRSVSALKAQVLALRAEITLLKQAVENANALKKYYRDQVRYLKEQNIKLRAEMESKE